MLSLEESGAELVGLSLAEEELDAVALRLEEVLADTLLLALGDADGVTVAEPEVEHFPATESQTAPLLP